MARGGRTADRGSTRRLNASDRDVACASAADVPALIAIDVTLVPRVRQDAIVREAVAAGRCLVARDGDAVAGYATWDFGFFNRAFVRLLAIGSAHRRRGLGDALLRRVEREAIAAGAGELFVSTETINAPMRALLARAGYAPSGSIDNVNEPGNAELVFHKRFAPSR